MFRQSLTAFGDICLSTGGRKIAYFVLFDIFHVINVFDVGWKSFSQIRDKLH